MILKGEIWVSSDQEGTRPGPKVVVDLVLVRAGGTRPSPSERQTRMAANQIMYLYKQGPRPLLRLPDVNDMWTVVPQVSPVSQKDFKTSRWRHHALPSILFVFFPLASCSCFCLVVLSCCRTIMHLLSQNSGRYRVPALIIAYDRYFIRINLNSKVAVDVHHAGTGHLVAKARYLA